MGKVTWLRRAQTRVEWLEVVRLDHDNWKISDTRLAEDDSLRLLGFVERLHRLRFEITKLTDPISWAYVPSFGQALASFEETFDFDAILEVERDRSLRMIDGRPRRRMRRRVRSDGVSL